MTGKEKVEERKSLYPTGLARKSLFLSGEEIFFSSICFIAAICHSNLLLYLHKRRKRQRNSMVIFRQLEQGMQQMRNYYRTDTHVLRNSFPSRLGAISSTYKNSFLNPRSKAEIKMIAAKKHSESERRRRMRINGQYATLRTILPNLVKMDKATVLSETVRHVKELKKKVAELEAGCRGNGEEIAFPGESDRVYLESCKKERGLLKATLSCEDRPQLMSAMARALKSVKGTVVRAEMVTVGGRTKSVLWVHGLEGGKEGILSLKRALKLVIHKPILSARTSGLISNQS